MSFLCALPLATVLFSGCAAPEPLAVGYVEGEYTLLAPMEAGRVATVPVRNGEWVEAGEVVFAMDARDAEIGVEQAKAQLAQARAELADLQTGSRPTEIAALKAAVAAADARLTQAERTLERTRDLHARGTASDAALDDAEMAADTAAAERRQAEANLANARLPARQQQIVAAAAAVEQAEAALAHARWRLSERTVAAGSAGRIDDVIRNPGDLAGPQAPVVSLLPEGEVVLKLYVPDEALAGLSVGTDLVVSCEGCPPGQRAEISYIAPEPEFTPPVIYSLETRQKLVHLVEARPAEGSRALQPGLLVDVRLAPGDDRG